MMTPIRRASALLASALLAGCGGSSATPRPPASAPTSAPAAMARANLTIVIGAPRTSAAARRLRYVSPGTGFVQIEINHATTQSLRLSAGTPCPVPAGASTCVVFTFDAPVGTDTFVVTAFQDAGNAVLGQGTTQATIVQGAANSMSVTLNARIASVTLSLAKPAPLQGAAARGLVMPVPLDAAGYSPVGSPGALPDISITDSDTSGTTALFIGTDTTCAAAAGASATTVTATQSGTGYVPVCMSYNGAALPSGATITATISGIAPATAAFNVFPHGTVSPGGWSGTTRIDQNFNTITQISGPNSASPGGFYVGSAVDQNDNVYLLEGPINSTTQTYQISVFSDTQSGDAAPLAVTKFTLPAGTWTKNQGGLAGPALDGNGNAYVLGESPNGLCTIYRVPTTGGTVTPFHAMNCGSYINTFGSTLAGMHGDAQGRVYVGYNNHVGPSSPGPSIVHRAHANPDGTLTEDGTTGGGYEVHDFAVMPAGTIAAEVDAGRVIVFAAPSAGGGGQIDTYDTIGFNTLRPPVSVDHAGNVYLCGANGASFGTAEVPAGTHTVGATNPFCIGIAAAP